ncbi:MAG: hypothetical protein AB1403_00560 [Candidatus Riflebacteria bacterium]
MDKDLLDSINRAREAQKGWIAHMKAEGWHGCPVCRCVPIQKDQRMCAVCQTNLKKKGLYRESAPPSAQQPVQPSLDLEPGPEPEKPVSPGQKKDLINLATYRKNKE